MRFNIALALVVVAVVWADIHFLLALFRAGQWWDVIPLIGMALLSYVLGWLVFSTLTQTPAEFDRQLRKTLGR